MYKLSCLVILAVLSTATCQALAAQDATKGLTNTDTMAVLNYWTPEKMRDAKPLPLPTVDPKTLRYEPVAISNSISAPGVPPKLKITPNTNPVFNNLTSNISSNFDTGSMNAPFSSSRLVPLSAYKVYPYSTVGQLYFTGARGANYVCSASVIGKRIILTAGHCVHSGSGGENGYYKNFVFVPARFRNTQPFGKWVFSYALTTDVWMNGNGTVPNAGDFAMLELQDNVIKEQATPIADVVGQLGYATQKLANNHLHLLGYPCNFDKCTMLHQVTAQSDKTIAPNNVQYGSDMRNGSSGGPWVQNFGVPAVGQNKNNFNQVVGVTSWGYISMAPKVQGAAIFDDNFTKLITAMCAHQTGNC